LAVVLGLAVGLGATRGVLAQPTSAAIASELAEAHRLNDEAIALYNAGKYDAAVPVALRALAIREKALGPDHLDVALFLTNLAGLYWAVGRLSKAILALTRGEDVREKTLGRLVTGGSEAQKLAYLATLRGELGIAVTLALLLRDPGASHLALTTLLRRKGRALDAMTGSLLALRARLDPAEQPLFDDLQAARAQYVTLALRGPGSTPLDAYRRELAELDERIQQREAAISARSTTFRAEQQPITVAPIQAALPDDAALVEWVVYNPFNPKAHTEREKWSPAHYAACVLPKHGDPTWVDLGAAETIDADIQSLRAAFRRAASNDVPALARALEARVMACTPKPEKASFENPLLKSGIALAGANACSSGDSHGLLTALEASSLDLYGTKLVVLSACQTGMGDVKAGDGVYGLRRALLLAGAETQVMSLWPVDESATTELMKAYYDALSKGGGRSEALRQVQLAMLHDPRWEHPYYWAGFIVSGADGALDGTAVMPDLHVHGLRGCACDLASSPGEDRWPAGLVSALGALLLAARRRSQRGGARSVECGEAKSVLRPTPGAPSAGLDRRAARSAFTRSFCDTRKPSTDVKRRDITL
jgi:hypothetical protein